MQHHHRHAVESWVVVPAAAAVHSRIPRWFRFRVREPCLSGVQPVGLGEADDSVLRRGFPVAGVFAGMGGLRTRAAAGVGAAVVAVANLPES